MKSNPTIVVVPGAACKVVHYNDLVRQLTSNGYETYVYDLPTASREPPQKPATLADDAEFFHDKIEELVSAGKDVVVVAHSYGGMAATDAAQGLAKAARADQGLAGGISRIVYLSCIVAEVGETAGELTANLNFDFMKPVENGEYLTQIPGPKGAQVIYSDLPLEEAVRWRDLQVLQSVPCYAGKTVYDAYRHIPVTYIYCSKDKVLTPDFQQERIEFLQKAAKEFDLRRLETGHCPNVSKPEETARVICDAIERKAVAT